MASSPQHEPTMEEILASIRKIISEDSSEPVPATVVAAPAETDVLELTHEVQDELPAPVVTAAEPPPMPEPVQTLPSSRPRRTTMSCFSRSKRFL